MLVYVLNINGQPLMPTSRFGKVRRLLKTKQAKVIKRCPFTIQLLYQTDNNTQDIKSEYSSWNDFPNMSHLKYTKINNTVWNNDEIKKSLENTNTSDSRLYTRWWASLIPHVKGYNKDGHNNNWWMYFKDMDYITKLNTKGETNLTYDVDDKFSISYEAEYLSGKVEELSNLDESFVTFSNKDILTIEDGWFKALNSGSTDVIISMENQSISYSVTINEGNGEHKIVVPPTTEESTTKIIADL